MGQITPEKMDILREQFLEIALENVDVLREIISGKKRANMQQVQVLKMVYAKVMPDLAATKPGDAGMGGGWGSGGNVDIPGNIDTTKMPREALEALVRGELAGKSSKTPSKAGVRGSKAQQESGFEYTLPSGQVVTIADNE